MHKKAKLSLVIAATAVAALVTAGAVSASSHSTTGATIDRAAITDMRALLLPKAVHPAGNVIDFEASLAQVGSASLPGVTYAPAACNNFLDVATPGLNQANGWLRATDRQSPSFDHNNYVLELDAQIAANPDSIRTAALSCSNGKITLEGKVTGTVSYKSVPATSQPGSTTLAFAVTVKFPAPTTLEQAKILAAHGYATPVGQSLNVSKAVNIVVTDSGLLYRIDSPSAKVADEAAAAFAKQALTIG